MLIPKLTGPTPTPPLPEGLDSHLGDMHMALGWEGAWKCEVKRLVETTGDPRTALMTSHCF